MQQSEQIKRQVLDRIANGNRWSVAVRRGPAKYRIGNSIVHLRYCTNPKANGITYAFNINPNTLDADYEIWICSTSDKYYLIPMSVIQDIYNDPHGYIDSRSPTRRIININTQSHRCLYAHGGRTVNCRNYYQGTF
jgi:hypothetical protein